jgi:hypothetical protein
LQPLAISIRQRSTCRYVVDCGAGGHVGIDRRDFAAPADACARESRPYLLTDPSLNPVHIEGGAPRRLTKERDDARHPTHRS